jgi:hypothetical protein
MIQAEASVNTEQIEAAFASLTPALQEALKDAANIIRTFVLSRSPVGDRPKQGPRFKDLWTSPASFQGGSIAFGNPADYADVLEQGKYPGVGPRTVAIAGKVYSRQAPGGVVWPVLKDQAKINDVMDLIVQQLLKGIQGAAKT